MSFLCSANGTFDSLSVKANDIGVDLINKIGCCVPQAFGVFPLRNAACMPAEGTKLTELLSTVLICMG